MRNVAIVILISASSVAQVTAPVVGVTSQGSMVRASIEIVNYSSVSLFVQTCFRHWNQNAAEVDRRDEAICFAWPQHLVRGAWKDVPAQSGSLGDYSPQQGRPVPPGESALLQAEFSSCLSPVSPRDILRLRIGPSPD